MKTPLHHSLPAVAATLIAIALASGNTLMAKDQPKEQKAKTSVRSGKKSAAAATGKLHPPRAFAPMEFLDGTVSGVLSPKQLAKLLTRKVKPLNEGWDQFMHAGAEGYVTTPTIATYRAAMADGASPSITLDEMAEAPFEMIHMTLTFLERAKPSAKSSIPASLKDLPVHLMEWNRPEEWEWLLREASAGQTLRSFQANKKIFHLRMPTKDTLRFDDSNLDYTLTLLAAGDIDGDSCEDLLFSSSSSPLEGFACYKDTVVMLAKQPNQPVATVMQWTDWLASVSGTAKETEPADSAHGASAKETDATATTDATRPSQPNPPSSAVPSKP